MRFAALKGLAKAINQVATEVDADLIVFKTHGRCRFAHLVALPSWWPCLADSIATTLACLVNRDHHPPKRRSRVIADSHCPNAMGVASAEGLRRGRESDDLALRPKETRPSPDLRSTPRSDWR